MSRRADVRERAEVAHAGGGWWLIHGLPLGAPGILCVGFALVIQWAHEAGGGDPIVTPLLAIAAFVIGAMVTGFGWLAAGKRMLMRLLVTVSGALGTLNLVIGLIVGFERAWLIYTYVVCSLIVWVLWVIWRGAKYSGSAGEGDSSGASPLLEAVRSAQVQFSKPTVDDRGVVRAKVQTRPGGTLDDARALVPLLSADARAVPGGTHISGHPDRDGVATIEIPTRDNLKAGVPWPGVRSVLGSLPTDPFGIGEYQSGTCTVRLVGDYTKDRLAPDIKHLKIGGVTGSGKSTGALVFLASLLVKRRLNVIGVDLSKELQTFGPVADGLTWVITDVEEARLFIARLSKVIEGRVTQLRREGLRRWTLDSKLNFLLIWVEESKQFRRFQAQYENVVADARSAGIMFVSSTQDWIYRSASTSVRKNHGAGLCFGMEEADDVGHVLPDEAIAALGKNGVPTWGSRKPGYCYVAGLGIPERLWPKMLRVYDPLDEQVMEAVELGARYRDPMDAVTAELFGELFARRIVYSGPQWGQPEPTAPAAWGRSEPAPPLARAAARQELDDPDRDPDAEEEAEAMAAEENAQDREEMFASLEASRRAELGDAATSADFADVDPDQEIDAEVEDDGDEDEEADRPKPSPAEAQRIWDTHLDGLYRAGVRGVETSQLTEWLTEVQRERTFLYRQIERWERQGCIRPRPDADGWDLVASPLEQSPSPPHGE